MESSGPVAAYLRTDRHASLFTAVNASDQTRVVSMPQGFLPQVTTHGIRVEGNQLILPPFSGACGQLRQTTRSQSSTRPQG